MSETSSASTRSSPVPVAGQAPFAPLVRELVPMPDSEAVFAKLVAQPHCLFLDSARRDRQLGRYSYIMVDPFDYLEFMPQDHQALDVLQEKMSAFTVAGSSEDDGELPPFRGGVAGLFGYDLAYSAESLPAVCYDEFQVPAMAVGFYDVVVAFDHQQNRAWIISQGLPHHEQSARQQRAEERLLQIEHWIYDELPHQEDESLSEESDLLPLNQLAPHFEVPGPAGLVSDFSAAGYCEAVARAVDYIYAGDIFQVNLSQRLLFPASFDSVSLYLRLRRCNAAPFAGYFETNQFQIVSASPERFLQVQQGMVEARPIKGTRRRSSHPIADLFTA